VLAEFHNRFSYLLVDEYQDTNVAQYLWLRLLAQKSQNLCCVGDDDQSIYGWRGAEVDNILRFERDFPGAKVVRLERNYRSTSHILAAASGLIATNKSRPGQDPVDREPGRREGRGARHLGRRGREPADRRRDRAGEEGRPTSRATATWPSWCAPPSRCGSFEERFVMLQIPYVVIGGPRFFERAEIRDAIAYLRLIQSPDDDLAFERIVKRPKRGIGDTTVQKLCSGPATGPAATPRASWC
jgi:DNA helicase-2/ATP-dependent DNA helicase PcrA